MSRSKSPAKQTLDAGFRLPQHPLAEPESTDAIASAIGKLLAVAQNLPRGSSRRAVQEHCVEFLETSGYWREG